MTNSFGLATPAALFDLRNKVACISGAASGIGKAQVELFLAAGAQVIALDIDKGGLTRLSDEWCERDNRLLCVPTDLTDAADLQKAVQAGHDAFGRIDILCNTAGFLDDYARSLDTSEVLWDKVFSVNVKSMYRLTNAILPGMMARGGGVIVNMASIAGFKAGGGGAAYTASKHAVIGYTRQLSSDYGRAGIRVNAVCPGMIETAMTSEVLADTESKLVKFLKQVPAGRLGRPEDVARVSLFLCGQGAEFIHGTTVVVDGGLMVR